MASVAQTAAPGSTLRAFSPVVSAEASGGQSSVPLEAGGLVPVESAAVLRVDPSEAEVTADPIPAAVLLLPVAVAVAVPVRNFRVRNLLAMRSGAVLETQWGHSEDLPLASGNVQLAWTEFEVIETQLAVRVTRLA